MPFKPTIQTAKRQIYNYDQIHDYNYDIEEIAWSLAHLCRYTGHINWPNHIYSVAQHSVLVSRIVPPEQALDGLLHDASEAYINDLNGPVKSLLPDYKALQTEIEVAIANQYMLTYPFSEEVHHADMVLLSTERRDMMDYDNKVNHLWEWLETEYTPLPDRIRPISIRTAFHQFMGRYEEIQLNIKS